MVPERMGPVWLKTARISWGESIVSTAGLALPCKSPSQWLKTQPVSGTAVSCTWASWGYLPSGCGAGSRVTAPFPCTCMDKGCCTFVPRKMMASRLPETTLLSGSNTQPSLEGVIVTDPVRPSRRHAPSAVVGPKRELPPLNTNATMTPGIPAPSESRTRPETLYLVGLPPPRQPPKQTSISMKSRKKSLFLQFTKDHRLFPATFGVERAKSSHGDRNYA